MAWVGPLLKWALVAAVLAAVAASEDPIEDPNQEVEIIGAQTDVVNPVFEPLPEGPNLMGQVHYDYSNYDSLKSRLAPPDPHNSGGVPFRITEQRLKEIRSQFMYWYFDQGGSENRGDYQKDIHTSTPQIHKNFNFQLPFFGFRFNYTRLSMHGYLEFSDPPEHFTYPLTFPVKEWPKKNDPSFIGIFYSKCRIGAIHPTDIDQRSPGVYFRQERDLQTRTDQFGVEMRERLMWDIREGVVGSDTFIPKHAVIVTWKNMSFAGGIDNSLYKTNTFQMVLATDEVYTYAIFNYAELQWTTHTEAGGDTTGGEGGTPAYVGFNAGNGTQSYEYHPYSQASTLRDLSGRGWANNFPGRHIFRLDEKIMLGTCNKDIAGANLPLVFAPESGNMLGGTIVNITGPCFEEHEKIICRFDTEDVVGVYVDRNRAICVQPFVMAEGYVKFEVAVGDGKFNWKGKYFVETPATATEKISFATNAVHEKNPSKVKITWNAYNLTSNMQANVQISLWGYKETTIRPELLYINMLVSSVTNQGFYELTPASYRDYNDFMVNDLTFGFIMINLTDPMTYGEVPVNPVLWSKPIPLAWYFAPQWERLYGPKWAEEQCDRWTMNDRYLKNFAAEIPLCPCTLEHALADKGRFLPDFDCDKDANPNCFYHKGAVHCVRTGAPSLEGSEQQCCYDKNNYLMLTYDQQWGSRPHRSHNLGFLPWNEANKVPTLSHWFHDMIPFYSCCLWQEEQAVGCETYRFERRPTQDCVAYQAPSVAAVFGDPHVVTFDDLEYTFNGKGEFVLVHADSERQKLDIQARFEQMPENFYGEVKATQLTSVVARDNSSATIEVRMRPSQAQWRYRMDVFADGKRVFFDRSSLKIQHFPGVTVYTPTYILNQSEVVIMFQSGAGVEVQENQGYMTTRVYLPWSFMNTTRGLFGNWSFDLIDDFTLPDGSIAGVSQINNNEAVHKQFGIHWLLEDKEDTNKGGSMFVHEYFRTSSYYANSSFEPEFRIRPEDLLPANRSQDIVKARELCGDSYQCQYDYAMTLNRDMALIGKGFHDAFVNIKAANMRPVVSCGVLETPRFGRKSNFFFIPGTKVTFECNQDFVLVGDQRRQCMPNGQWDVPPNGYTECLRHQEYESRQAWVTIGIILLVMLPIVIFLAGFWLRYNRRNHKKNGSGGVQSWSFVRSQHSDSPDTPLKTHEFEDVDSGFAPPSTPSANTDTLSPPASTPSPKQQQGSSPPNSTLSSRGSKKRVSYDKVYRTGEPLPGKPMTEFEPKVWDLDEETDLSLSVSNRDSEAASTIRSSILSTPMQSPRTSQIPPPPPPPTQPQPSTSQLAYQPVYQEVADPPKPKKQTLV